MARLRRGTGNRPPNAKDIAAKEARRLRRKRVGELAVVGVRQADIAHELGISQRQVAKDLQRYFAEHESEDAASFREKLNARYARYNVRLERVVAEHVGKTDPKSAAVVVRATAEQRRIAEAQARLNGAEAPRAVSLSLPDGPLVQNNTVVAVRLEDALDVAEENAVVVSGEPRGLLPQ